MWSVTGGSFCRGELHDLDVQQYQVWWKCALKLHSKICNPTLPDLPPENRRRKHFSYLFSLATLHGAIQHRDAVNGREMVISAACSGEADVSTAWPWGGLKLLWRTRKCAEHGIGVHIHMSKPCSRVKMLWRASLFKMIGSYWWDETALSLSSISIYATAPMVPSNYVVGDRLRMSHRQGLRYRHGYYTYMSVSIKLQTGWANRNKGKKINVSWSPRSYQAQCSNHSYL